MSADTRPFVAPVRTPDLPAVAERKLNTGLGMVAASRPGVPRVEVRLRVPFGSARPTGDGARERLLADTVTAGTAEHSALALAQELQRLGASLRAHATSEELLVSGSCLVETAVPFLELIDEVLRTADYADEEVTVAKGRAAQEATIVRSQPTVMASDALVDRLYGKHPYGRGTPPASSYAGISPLALRKVHAARVVPAGSTIVLVGDMRPHELLEMAAGALGRWKGDGPASGLKAPAPPAPGPTLLVDRPGSVQSNIRLGGMAVGRAHPDHARVQVANIVFGGYFSSRLVANLRENKGFSYSPRSSIGHRRLASELTVAAEVATEVTVPALLEIRYELARMAAGTLSTAELDSAKRYLVGTLALATQTQSGLASYLSAITADGLTIDYLATYPSAVEAVTVDDVMDASLRFLGPRGLQTVIVGDASTVERPLGALDELELTPAPPA
ncbi:MAG: zinc protease [Actinomycetota bacterium]|jgi:predicted Zn-dependent peptidase